MLFALLIPKSQVVIVPNFQVLGLEDWIDISWKIRSIVFARVELTEVELTEVEMAEWSSSLFTKKSSQLGSQNKKTACYVTDETNITNVIEF